MGRVVAGEGTARTLLPVGVTLLHPQDAVLDAMLEGWQRQQRGGRNLQRETIESRISLVRRFVHYTNDYPWGWTAAQFDEWMASLVSERKLAPSTLRTYQGAIRLFCDYLTSPYYQWPEECQERFGTHPIQVCHEWNTLPHLVDYEGRPGRRPLTRDEVQVLLDYADDRVEHAVRRGRKGALAAYRDATVFKVIYGWGLRCAEAAKLETTDWHRNPRAPELAGMGALQVRYGKATRGSPSRRRTVLSVMPWAVEAVEDYLTHIRPRYRGVGPSGSLWPTERGSRLSSGDIEDRFAEYRDALGLDQDLTPHCLRHSYVTHLIEDGADAQFVQRQVGHVFASTTAIYTGVSTDFMNTMFRKFLDRAIEDGEE